MLDVKLNHEDGLVVLEPHGALTEDDFIMASQKIDPFIKEYGLLKGVVIYAESFPGWNSFGAFFNHLKFVNNHHEKILRVALVTNSVVGNLAELIVSHFISAEIKKFSFEELEVGKKWVLSH